MCDEIIKLQKKKALMHMRTKELGWNGIPKTLSWKTLKGMS